MTTDSERRGTIWEDILAERARQDAQHGGPAHDETLVPVEWVQRIVSHANRSLLPEQFRHRMVNIAAMAVAAIEVFDRGRMPVTKSPPGMRRNQPPGRTP